MKFAIFNILKILFLIKKIICMCVSLHVYVSVQASEGLVEAGGIRLPRVTDIRGGEPPDVGIRN